MNLKELNNIVDKVIKDLKDNGNFPKENDFVDYKLKLKINTNKDIVENFLINFAKDIISFSNADGGIILIGINEDKNSGELTEVGLESENIELLNKIDLNDVGQKFQKFLKSNIKTDLQQFQIGTKYFYYLTIEKNNDVVIPISDHKEYGINKGEIWYRVPGRNEHATQSTSNINEFIHIKSNEKSKEFMAIWSRLLPEMVNINPKEVLLLNPIKNRVYGFNSADQTLSGSEIQIDKEPNGVFNIILEAITAGEIGKITDNEGKPIYKIVGELQSTKPHISLTSLVNETLKITKYKFTTQQVKKCCHHLGWVSSAKFKIINPPESEVNKKFSKYIWIEVTDSLRQSKKVYFSPEAISEIKRVIDDSSLHMSLFGKMLNEQEHERDSYC